MTVPYFKGTQGLVDPLRLYRSLTSGIPQKPSVLLESARVSGVTGRYSLVAAKPFMIFSSRDGITRVSLGRSERIFKTDPFKVLQNLLKKYTQPLIGQNNALFLGGAVGSVSYEAKRWIEPQTFFKKLKPSSVPEMHFLFFNEGYWIDHVEECVWIFSKSKKRAESLNQTLKKVKSSQLPKKKEGTKLAMPSIRAEITREEFMEGVKKAKCYIHSGDIFQANLSQGFDFKFKDAALSVYERLRAVNPSPFFGLLDAGIFQIISGSPERLVSLNDGKIQTRPIAGTRFRGKTALEDDAVSLDLLLNEKERAEHIMLVDLERNDMGRVAEYGSVKVSELMGLENYSHVKHIVSNVEGTLRKNLDAVDVLRAFFPGGTITGAPKVRSMEIIDEIERPARGFYTGSMGYIGFNGNMDMNILIRSLFIQNGKAVLQVGAGIVADSGPEREYDETLHKAAGVFSALFGERRAQRFLQSRRTAARVS